MNRKNLLVPIFLVIIASVIWIAIGQDGKSVLTITPEEVYALMQSDSSFILLDVRTESEYSSESGHLKDAILLPVQELQDRLAELEPLKRKSMVVYCRSGNRSGRAVSLLSEHGFKAYNMVGGILRWNAEKLPVVFSYTRD